MFIILRKGDTIDVRGPNGRLQYKRDGNISMFYIL